MNSLDIHDTSFENITEVDPSRTPEDAAEWKDVPNKLELLDRGE